MNPLQRALIEKAGHDQGVDGGDSLVSPAISEAQRRRLGLDRPLRLRWLADEHLPYLRFQRDRFRCNRISLEQRLLQGQVELSSLPRCDRRSSNLTKPDRTR